MDRLMARMATAQQAANLLQRRFAPDLGQPYQNTTKLLLTQLGVSPSAFHGHPGLSELTFYGLHLSRCYLTMGANKEGYQRLQHIDLTCLRRTQEDSLTTLQDAHDRLILAYQSIQSYLDSQELSIHHRSANKHIKTVQKQLDRHIDGLLRHQTALKEALEAEKTQASFATSHESIQQNHLLHLASLKARCDLMSLEFQSALTAPRGSTYQPQAAFQTIEDDLKAVRQAVATHADQNNLLSLTDVLDAILNHLVIV